MGTATYFSPEQAQGMPLDPRSDLYSLGVVLYEMVTGRPPFSGDSPVAIAYKHVQEQPMPPRQVNADVPADLEAIDMKLLAKSPATRYASAEDLRADLRRFREGQPVLAAGAMGATQAMAATSAVPAYDEHHRGAGRGTAAGRAEEAIVAVHRRADPPAARCSPACCSRSPGCSATARRPTRSR